MISRALSIALALSVACSAWLWYRMDAAQDELAEVRAGLVTAALTYSENARQAEANETQRRQEIADAKDQTLRRVRAGLLADLDELRNRPDRVPGTDSAPRAACTGATGAELYRADAEFLSREAARAEELRSEFDACQRRERGEVGRAEVIRGIDQ